MHGGSRSCGGRSRLEGSGGCVADKKVKIGVRERERARGTETVDFASRQASNRTKCTDWAFPLPVCGLRIAGCGKAGERDGGPSRSGGPACLCLKKVGCPGPLAVWGASFGGPRAWTPPRRGPRDGPWSGSTCSRVGVAGAARALEGPKRAASTNSRWSAGTKPRLAAHRPLNCTPSHVPRPLSIVGSCIRSETQLRGAGMSGWGFGIDSLVDTVSPSSRVSTVRYEMLESRHTLEARCSSSVGGE